MGLPRYGVGLHRYDLGPSSGTTFIIPESLILQGFTSGIFFCPFLTRGR